MARTIYSLSVMGFCPSHFKFISEQVLSTRAFSSSYFTYLVARSSVIASNCFKVGADVRARRGLHVTAKSHYPNNAEKLTSANIRERNTTVTSFYNQTAIDEAAKKPCVRLTPSTIMSAGNASGNSSLLKKSAQYLHRELPIRIAHRIAMIRNLPFIVGCNPSILSVHEMHIKAFRILNDFPEIVTPEDVENYSQVLRDLMDDHKDIIQLMAQGFKECRRHIADEDVIRRYLDKNLTSRLGVRMLATHYLHLKDNKPDHVGIININMNLKKVIDHWATFSQQLATDKYGHAPDVRIYGHVNAHFPYIEMPLDYILPELFKNALRATIEAHPDQKGNALPSISVTIANNESDFFIKISDRGGGIPRHKVHQVMQYNFSTAEESNFTQMDDGVLNYMMENMNQSTSGPMQGFGFGLPTSRAYAEYLGGSLDLYSMYGLGTDVYLRLKHFDTRAGGDTFRI